MCSSDLCAWCLSCVCAQLQSEVEKPLLTFRDNFKKDMKRFDHHIADLRKQLLGRYAAVEKVRVTTSSRCCHTRVHVYVTHTM